MAPATPRELKVTYGGLAVGGSDTDYEIDGYTVVRTGDREGSVEFSFVVAEATESDFIDACQTVEAAFRKPYQDLLVELNGSAILTLAQSGNTALDPRPEILKRGQDGDTARSRIYTVRIAYGLPANTGAEPEAGLRESAVSVRYTPARKRTVTISGTFTAVPGSDARAQYESRIDAFAAAVLTAIGGTYDLVEETAEHDTNDRLLTFSRTYEEIVQSQGPVTDDADINRFTLSVRFVREGPGDTPKAGRLATLELVSEVWVDKTRTTNLPAKFDGLRDWYVTEMQSTLGSGDFALVHQDVDYDSFENRFTVRMTAKGVATKETVFENQITVEDALSPGVQLVPAWTGNPFSRYRYEAHSTLRRTFSQRKTVPGRISTKAAAEAGVALPNGVVAGVFGVAGGGQWEEVERRARVTPRTLGIDDHTMEVSDVEVTIVMEFWREAAGGDPHASVPTYR